MTTRPTVSMEWASVSPAAGPTFNLTQAQGGWLVDEEPPAQWLNYWQNSAWQWQTYLETAATGALVHKWQSQTSASVRIWTGITYSSTLSLLIAVASDGTTANQIMTSPDGVIWSPQTSPSARQWTSVTAAGVSAGKPIVAVAQDGTTANQIMTSTDGVTWTSRTSPSARQWKKVTYSSFNSLFVAVAQDGTTANQIMTSTDGITWTSRTSPSARAWQSVAARDSTGNNLIAVANDGTTANQVMTSFNGTTWSTGGATPSARPWVDVVVGDSTDFPGMAVAVASDGLTTSIMSSSDFGATWNQQKSITDMFLSAITYSADLKLFVATTSSTLTGLGLLTSPDGVNWTGRPAPSARAWSAVAWSQALNAFCAVANDGAASNQVATSLGLAQASSAASVATSLAKRDANKNSFANAWAQGVATTAAAGGSGALTVASAPVQEFTGSSTYTLTLPDATTLTNGMTYEILNRSTGKVTVNTNGGSLLIALNGGNDAFLTLISNGTSAGTWDIPQGGQTRGTITNDNANTGNVGEQIRSAVVIGSAVSLTNNTNTDITNIVLTAGDWDISSVCSLHGTLTGTVFDHFIGTASGNNTTGRVLGDNDFSTPSMSTANSDLTAVVPCYRVSISATTTYYLKALCSYSGGTATAYGRISARRTR